MEKQAGREGERGGSESSIDVASDEDAKPMFYPGIEAVGCFRIERFKLFNYPIDHPFWGRSPRRDAHGIAPSKVARLEFCFGLNMEDSWSYLSRKIREPASIGAVVSPNDHHEVHSSRKVNRFALMVSCRFAHGIRRTNDPRLLFDNVNGACKSIVVLCRLRNHTDFIELR
jgi:hypothetical protein